MTEDEVRTAIRKRIGKRKAYEWAEEVGISAAYLSQFLSGKKRPGPKILDALGLEVSYRRYNRIANKC